MSASALPLDPPAQPVAVPPTAVPFDGLTFFTRGGALRSPRREREAGEEVSLAARFLALPEGGVPASRLVRRLWSARSRVDAARLLLAEALEHDRAGRTREAEETWSWVGGEWTWLANSPRAARVLRAELGCEEEALEQLQLSVETELLPMLHLLAVLRAGRGKLAPCHLEFVSTFQLRRDAPPGLVVAAALAAAALGEAERDVPVACIEHVSRAVAGKLLPPRAERSVVSHFARGMARAISQTVTAGAASAMLEPLERLAANSGPYYPLVEVLSHLHCVMALRIASQERYAAYQFLGKALLYDPTNNWARSQRARFHDMDGMRVPIYARDQVQQRLREADQSVQEFARTPRGRKVQQRFEASLELELVDRLRLDPADPRHRWAAAGLLEHLERIRAVPEAKLRQQDLAQAWPELATFPVEQLGQAVAGVGNAPMPLIALTLPVRDPLPCSSLAPAPPAEGPGAPRQARTLVWVWCGSTRDLAFKLAAAAGVLLALHGAGRMAEARWVRSREDRAYSAALVAARARDDAALVRDGSTYLAMISRSAGPRSEQVRALVSEALVREAAKAVRAGRADDGRGLLLAHRDLLRDDAAPGAPQKAEVAR